MLLGDTNRREFAATLSARVVRKSYLFVVYCSLVLNHVTLGVPTGIVQASNPDLWDNAALETMSPVHQAHASDRPKGLGVEPDDIAQCLLFLISKQSKRISGAVIPIDNAWSVI